PDFNYKSDAAVGAEAAVDGDDDARDEARGVGREPEHRAKQVIRLAEAVHRRVGDDLLAARGEISGFLVYQQIAVLFSQEKAGRDGVDADVGVVLLRHVDGQPLGEVVDGG